MVLSMILSVYLVSPVLSRLMMLVQYMGKANAMDGPSNMFLNVLCYSTVFIIIRVHPSIALKVRFRRALLSALSGAAPNFC